MDHANKGRIPVIIDTDPGVDDIIAILLALTSPEIEILAFVVTFGNTDVNSSYRNVLKTYEVIERHLKLHPEDRHHFPNFFPEYSTPILVKGCEGPLEGELHSAQYFHGRDGLGEITERHPELNFDPTRNIVDFHNLQFSTDSGASVILEQIQSRPARSITYIALGPLTTLATVIRQDASTFRERIGRVVCMGGALDVPGNTSPVAEFNFFADPFAVKELLIPSNSLSGLPMDRFVLLSLDTTATHELPFQLYKSAVDPAFESSAMPSVAAEKKPVTHFTSSFLERTREVMISFGKDAMELHDIVAVWCAMQNPPKPEGQFNDTLATGWKANVRRFDIERTGEITRGMLVVDRRGEQLAYAPGTNRAEVQKALRESNYCHGELESVALPAQVNVDCVSELESHGRGVLCITETPGIENLLKILLERVWGVQR
ncbi:Inosine/uridine-preferring nucleoside hydrolase domain-containing protein [Cyathus striatus]|nr:Inosine/uridine-preferring nucleoside hydrolase domain-containing protein [Cyathus striatus]